MSSEDEGPPPMSPQLHDFLEAHQETGEPTRAELGRALLRLHGSTRPSLLSRAVGLRFLPPEVMAVAAVLVLSVGGAFIGWRVRSANAQTEALTQAKAAWVKGDLDGASAAFEACSTAECARLAAAVKRAKQQGLHLEALDEVEAGSLLALDRELSQGERSVLADRLDKERVESAESFATRQRAALLEEGREPRAVNAAVEAFIRGAADKTPTDEARRALAFVVTLVPETALARAATDRLAGLPQSAPVPVDEAPPRPEVAELLDKARDAKKERRYDEGILVLTQCLARFPDQPDCVVSMASMFATRGSQTNDASDSARARDLYRRFLRVAPPTDKRIDRVREIIASSPEPADVSVPCDARWKRSVETSLRELGERVAYRAEEFVVRYEKDEARVLQLVRSAETRNSASCASAERAVATTRKIYAELLLSASGAPTKTNRATELYARGYQLKETDPAGARVLFAQVIELAPDSIEAQKARHRLEELADPPAPENRTREVEVEGDVSVAINERKTMVIKGMSRVALGDSEIADVQTLGNDRLEVRGLRPGTTTLVVWTAGGQRVASQIQVTGAGGPRGRLKIASNPSLANVIVDGKSTGRKTPVLPMAPLELPVGRHTLQFELNGKRSAVQSFDVVEGDNPVLKGEIPQ